MAKPQPKKKKPKTLPQLEKILDALFSKYIRQKYSAQGNVQCYTCGTIKPIEEMQCGHLYGRKRKSTRFEEGNCRVQCMQCNVFDHGNYDVFIPKIIKEIGLDEYFLMEIMSRMPVKRSRIWYENMIETYKTKLEESKCQE